MVQKWLHAVYPKVVLQSSNERIGRICELHANSMAHSVRACQQQGLEKLNI